MSDERSTHSSIDENETADDADSNTGLEPGGGPQRVVSEESVDDILDSLEETSDAATADGATTTVSESTESVTTEFDEDDIPAADGVEADTDVDGPSPASTTDSTPTEPESEPDREDDTATDTDDAPTDRADTVATGADAPSIDAVASSLPDGTDGIDDTDGASLEDLADRIEEGTVTGADVRAAEAGEGRGSTPEIDEVELSMDDLETTQAGGLETDDRLDDAGPLAGSVDRDAETATDGDDGAASDDASGLFGRIKRFFSR